jgi:hypothetical protein
MGLFGFGKGNKGFVDLAEHYRKQREKKEEVVDLSEQKPTPLADMFFAAEQGVDSPELSGTLDDRKKKLAKRLADMTSKMEDLGNQIYHLQQRVELIEKKLDANKY